MGHLLIFGLGYTATRIAEALRIKGWQVDATGSAGNVDFANTHDVRTCLSSASHVLSSVPPDRKSDHDPVLAAYDPELETGGHWLGYLSSTGVYGDAAGAWVDETNPTVGYGAAGRRNARSDADAAWLKHGARVFRLPGIYGPGRSAFDRLSSGKARRIDLPDQVFSRVHVDDIVSGVIAGLEPKIAAPAGAYNLSDDLPASSNAVIEEACRLSNRPLPPLQSLEEAKLSPMAQGFYAENRRVANNKAKRVLQWKPQYPTFMEGLASLL